jgi:hypothetical protein
MRFRLGSLGFILLIGITILVGCSTHKQAMENEYSYQDLITAFESQNLKLASYGMTGTVLTLNKVAPQMNSIESEATVDNADPEFVYFYIFTTEAARQTGAEEFNYKMQTAKFTTYPFLYEKGNVLIIYWANSKGKPFFNESIHSAINNLVKN